MTDGPSPTGSDRPEETGSPDQPTSAADQQRAGRPDERRGVSRRGLFAGAGAGVALGALGGIGGTLAFDRPAAAAVAGPGILDLGNAYPFYGTHQAGVQTEPQRYCVFMTFDISAGSLASDLQVLLARWSASINQVMAGKPIGQVQPTRAGAVGVDTGEALDLGPSSLTVTLGLGPGVFDKRFGLAAKRPRLLSPLPQLPSDNLQAAITGGDLSLQACADDPQVAYHAIRDLARVGRGVVDTRWAVLGFGRASAGPHQATPRTLLGFKDGTRNIKEQTDFDSYVWVNGTGSKAPRDVSWMTGGSYQVARKIEMNIEIWDADDVTDQQRVFGRSKQLGAPLSGQAEFDTPDFGKRATTGSGTAIDPRAHIALAAHENNNGLKILRRSYNYTDGINADGQLDAGLLFLAYMNDPGHFVTLQRKLGGSDRLNEYISHIGSALFAIPPAPAQGHFLAEGLFS